MARAADSGEKSPTRVLDRRIIEPMDLVLAAFVAWVVLSLPLAILVGAALDHDARVPRRAAAEGGVAPRRERVLAAAPEPDPVEVVSSRTR